MGCGLKGGRWYDMPIKKSYIDFIPLDSPPEPVEGRVYYDNTEKKLKYYNGTEWVEVEYTG